MRESPFVGDIYGVIESGGVFVVKIAYSGEDTVLTQRELNGNKINLVNALGKEVLVIDKCEGIKSILSDIKDIYEQKHLITVAYYPKGLDTEEYFILHNLKYGTLNTEYVFYGNWEGQELKPVKLEREIDYIQPSVHVLDHTVNPKKQVAVGARNCYSEKTPDELTKDLSLEEIDFLVEKILDLGHYSVLEHAKFTFGIICSRVTSHQLVRKRIGFSYSQKSERYVDSSGFRVIVPPSIKNNPELFGKFHSHMLDSRDLYKEMRENEIPKEDARFLLPRIATDIVVTANVRALYDYFEVRCCQRTQWEHRAIANLMLKKVKEVSPLLFSRAGVPCITDGVCPEGDMSCGRLKRRKELSKANR